VDKKEYHIFLLKSIEQQHLFYESAYKNRPRHKKCKRLHYDSMAVRGVARRATMKALTIKKKKKHFPLNYSTNKIQSQGLLKKDL
jgi:hypothetical protein